MVCGSGKHQDAGIRLAVHWMGRRSDLSVRVYAGYRQEFDAMKTALIERLEKALRGDRVLTGQLVEALGGEVHWSHKRISLAVRNIPGEGWSHGSHWVSCPDYTGSTDKAARLAQVAITGAGMISLDIAGSAQVTIHHTDPCAPALAESIYGNTPALALCIAILKARTAASSSSVGTTEGRAPSTSMGTAQGGGR